MKTVGSGGAGSPWRRLRGVLLTACAVIGGGCGVHVDGGAGDPQSQGWQDRGRNPGRYHVDRGTDAGSSADGVMTPGPWQYTLSYADVMLTPDGKRLLASVPVPGPGEGWAKAGLVLVAYDFATGEQHVLQDVMDPVRINFSPDGQHAFVLVQGGRLLLRLDLAKLVITGQWPLTEAASVIDVTPDGQRVLLTNLPRNAQEELLLAKCTLDKKLAGELVAVDVCRVQAVELATAGQWSFSTEVPIRDLDVSPVNDELVLTLPGPGQLQARIEFRDPQDGTLTKALAVDNCADELVIDPKRQLGLLSPTACQQDPITIIDLATRKHVKTLPGFGPVALVPGGKHAIGFTRKQDMATQWQFEQEQPYGLIRVDLDTLEWQVIELGAHLPGFVVAPDGSAAYVYRAPHIKWASWGNAVGGGGELRRLDLKTWQLEVVPTSAGPERLTWGPNGALFFVHSGILYEFDPQMPAPTPRDLPNVAELLNYNEKRAEIVTGEGNRPRFQIVPLAAAGTPTAVDLSLGAELAPPPPWLDQKGPGWRDVIVRDLSTAATCTEDTSPGTDVGPLTLWRKSPTSGKWLPVAAAGDGSYLPAIEPLCQDHPLGGQVEPVLRGLVGKWLSLNGGQVVYRLRACLPDALGPHGCLAGGDEVRIRPGDRVSFDERGPDNGQPCIDASCGEKYELLLGQPMGKLPGIVSLGVFSGDVEGLMVP